MADRASSSSACSSSSTAPALFAGWFPSTMVGEPMRVSVRGLTCPGSVQRVELQQPFWTTVHFRIAKPPKTRFSVGDLATLYGNNGPSWSGDVAVIKDGDPPLWTVLQIRVPSSRGGKILLKSDNNFLVMVSPVASLPGLSSQTEMVGSSEAKEKETRIRVGVNGFRNLGMILVEMGLQSFDVQVVAINDPKMTVDQMVRMWKSRNISVAKKDHQTLIFEKMYYKQKGKKMYSKERGKKIKFDVLLEQMEVTIFREQNQVPWERVNADFVVDYNTFFNNDKVQISDNNESLNNCLRRHLPNVFLTCVHHYLIPVQHLLPVSFFDGLNVIIWEMYAFGLNVDEELTRPRFNKDNGENSRRAATFSIVTRSTVAANAVLKALPEWDEQPTSCLFHANAVVDRSIDVDVSSVDLMVTLEKAECCRGTNSIVSRFCVDDKYVKHRVVGIFSWCVDILRCLPVRGCQLELI